MNSINELETGIPASDIPGAPAVSPTPPGLVPRWLLAQVPEGEDYLQYMSHPLNVAHSEGVAMMLCGIRHILGGISLRYAVMYIVMGAIRLVKEARPKVPGQQEDKDVIINGRPPNLG